MRQLHQAQVARRNLIVRLAVASGSDVKIVQARLPHASVNTMLDTYGHLWPDTDDSTRAAVAVAMAAREGKQGQRKAVRPKPAGHTGCGL